MKKTKLSCAEAAWFCTCR